MIVLAAPATQVSVERLFDELALILSDLRERVGSDNAQNILSASDGTRVSGCFPGYVLLIPPQSARHRR